jgi:hypothetical protein
VLRARWERVAERTGALGWQHGTAECIVCRANGDGSVQVRVRAEEKRCAAEHEGAVESMWLDQLCC